jgi:CheY-like chemotaxis protein
MFERESFVEQVHDAFAHLHEMPYLRAHALVKLLAPTGGTLSAAHLRGLLLGAVEQLRPPPDAPPQSIAWRRYRYLHLRYVEGASHETIARALFISTRQARRDHIEGLEAVASILWEGSRPSWIVAPAEAAAPASISGPGGQAALDAELLKTELDEDSLRSDFAEVISGVVEIAGKLAGVHGGRIDLSVPTDLPPAAVDRTILRQILLNLLSYAIQIAPGSRLSLVVSDDGDAIVLEACTEELAVQVEQRDGPAATADEPQASLATSQRLAELHGVRVGVERGGASPLTLRVAVPEVRARTVLVIDDNPDVAKLFERYLRGTGFRLVHARIWQRALQLAKEAQPDVITLDVMMPSLDGWDILQRLRELPNARGIPIVVCSVLPERSLALAMGASGFLAKPFTRRSLLAALGEALVTPRDAIG